MGEEHWAYEDHLKSQYALMYPHYQCNMGRNFVEKRNKGAKGAAIRHATPHVGGNVTIPGCQVCINALKKAGVRYRRRLVTNPPGLVTTSLTALPPGTPTEHPL